MLTLNFKTNGRFDRAIYVDQYGKYWMDISINPNIIDLYASSTDDIDGEPDYPILEPYEIIRDANESHPKAEQYRMLDELRHNCEYFINYGFGEEHRLTCGSVEKQIELMKLLYNQFDEIEKPEWLSLSDIETLTNRMQEARDNE